MSLSPLHVGVWCDLILHRLCKCCDSDWIKTCSDPTVIFGHCFCIHPPPLALTVFLPLSPMSIEPWDEGMGYSCPIDGSAICSLFCTLASSGSLYQSPATANKSFSDTSWELHESVHLMRPYVRSQVSVLPIWQNNSSTSVLEPLQGRLELPLPFCHHPFPSLLAFSHLLNVWQKLRGPSCWLRETEQKWCTRVWNFELVNLSSQTVSQHKSKPGLFPAPILQLSWRLQQHLEAINDGISVYPPLVSVHGSWFWY